MEIGLCKECSPNDWRTHIEEHNCASNDEYNRYGTIVYSLPRHSGSLNDRYFVHEWPQCQKCGEEYCTFCGEKAWYQCL